MFAKKEYGENVCKQKAQAPQNVKEFLQEWYLDIRVVLIPALLKFFLYFPSLAASEYNFFFFIPLQSSTRTDHHSKTCGAMTLSFKKTKKPTLIKKVLKFVWNYWPYVRIYSKSWFYLNEFGDLFWMGRSHWRRTSHWLHCSVSTKLGGELESL